MDFYKMYSLTNAGGILLVFWLITCASVLNATKDIVSPLSIYCAITGLFFSNIFFYDYDYLIICIYMIILILINISCVAVYGNMKSLVRPEAYKVKNISFRECNRSYDNYYIFYLVSMPAIISELYIIIKFGGIIEYLSAAKFATEKFQGYGPAKILISTIYPINLYFYAITLVNHPSKSKNFKNAYRIHLILTLLIAISTISRGTLLTHLLFLMLIKHYGVKKLKAKFFIFLGIVLITLAGLYGVIRENYQSSTDGFKLGLGESSELIKTEWMDFGVYPLKMIFEAPYINEKFGLTYITAITNLIPRIFWPDKPDPGGVVFTEEYAAGLYDEFSHYSTGIYPEAIINFGIAGGIIMGSFQILTMMIFISLYHYKRYFSYNNRSILTTKKAKYIVIYVVTLWAFPVYLTGEFTSVTIGYLTKLGTIILVHAAFVKSFRFK